MIRKTTAREAGAYTSRLDARIRRAIGAGDPADPRTAGDRGNGAASVDNSVDKPPGARGDIEGGYFPVESEGRPSPETFPRIRNLESRHGGQTTELELIRGYGLDVETFEARR